MDELEVSQLAAPAHWLGHRRDRSAGRRENQAAARSATLCYVHIPKAAGTTLNHALRTSLGHRFLEVEPWVDIRRVISPADLVLLHRWLPWVRHISSHYVRAYSALETAAHDIRYITIMREPIDRYISAYYHNRDRSFRVANIYEYANNRSWWNIQTKYVAGSDDIEAAKKLLRERFAFVGLAECMNESLALLSQVSASFPACEKTFAQVDPRAALARWHHRKSSLCVLSQRCAINRTSSSIDMSRRSCTRLKSAIGSNGWDPVC
jgi:hypothetical protein